MNSSNYKTYAPLQLKPLQFKNQIKSSTKFLKFGIVLYKHTRNIKSELSVKAKYCPQCIPIESVPDLSKSDLITILNYLFKCYKII